jgi:hypothetical protein
VEVRVIVHRFGVAGPYRLSAVHQDHAVGVFDDDVRGVVVEAAIEIVGMIGVDRRLNDVSWLHRVLLWSLTDDA